MDEAYKLTCAAACWLKLQKQCPIIMTERGLNWSDHPDVLGVDDTRRLLECEVKTSVKDFRRDAKKHKWRLQERGYIQAPAYFWYVMPVKLGERMQKEIRPGCGLLVPAGNYWANGMMELKSLVKSRRNAESKKLTLRECIRMAKNQSGTILSQMTKNIALIDRLESSARKKVS